MHVLGLQPGRISRDITLIEQHVLFTLSSMMFQLQYCLMGAWKKESGYNVLSFNCKIISLDKCRCRECHWKWAIYNKQECTCLQLQLLSSIIDKI